MHSSHLKPTILFWTTNTLQAQQTSKDHKHTDSIIPLNTPQQRWVTEQLSRIIPTFCVPVLGFTSHEPCGIDMYSFQLISCNHRSQRVICTPCRYVWSLHANGVGIRCNMRFGGKGPAALRWFGRRCYHMQSDLFPEAIHCMRSLCQLYV